MSLTRKILSFENSTDGIHKNLVIFGIRIPIKYDLTGRYKKIISSFKKNEKTNFKVLFLVNEIAKWKTQSLYDLMEENKHFEPIIALTIADKQWDLSKEEKEKIIERNYEYFSSKNMKCIKAYDTENHIPLDLKQFNPDIVFYQQPWGIAKIQKQKNVSKYALTCYVPYYVPNYGILQMDCKLFHKNLFRYYVLNNDWKNIYDDYIGQKDSNIRAAGHTMLDDIYLKKEEIKNEGYVIYAPHWSIKHPKNPNDEYYSTFDQNGKEILEYAKQHPEIKWVFKPHPTLKKILYEIEEWTPEEIENYYSEWSKIGIACYDSNYIELFLKSKAMITDCGSFLIEYFCTGKPLLHLISAHCKGTPPVPTQKIFDTFYKVHNNEELFQYLDDIIIKNNDPLADNRKKVLKDLEITNNYAAKNIIEDLERVIAV